MNASIKAHPIIACVKGLPVEKTVLPAYKYLRVSSKLGDTWWELCPLDKVPDPTKIDDYIEWCMPAHDLTRPERKHCGFLRTKNGEYVFERCKGDFGHPKRAKSFHCWSLSCPNCFYAMAVREGVAAEVQCKRYEGLWNKKGVPVPKPFHLVVSPPQEMIKSVMQTRTQYNDLNKIMWKWLEECGATGGRCYFHPWRQKEHGWELGPHFHWIVYGDVQLKRFSAIHDGWIVKNPHRGEPIHSVLFTVAYLCTHKGLPATARNPDDVDWNDKLFRYLMRNVYNPDGDYTDEDYDKFSRGKGRMVGDISDVDWLKWAEDKLTYTMRDRSWGELARNQFVKIGKKRTYRNKRCKCCGELITVHNGLSDLTGSKVEYIQDDGIVAFASDAKEARLEYENYVKTTGDKIPFDEFVKQSKVLLCDSEFYHNKDPVVEKFDRSDEFYLRRQKRAFGPALD